MKRILAMMLRLPVMISTRSNALKPAPQRILRDVGTIRNAQGQACSPLADRRRARPTARFSHPFRLQDAGPLTVWTGVESCG